MAKKKATKKVARRDIERPYNGGTWSSSRYFTFIRSALRSASTRWPPKFECLKAAYVDTRINKKTGRMSKHYRCAMCFSVFPTKEVQVDHITPAGSLTRFDDLPGFAERLFCEINGFRVLCLQCHHQVTQAEKSNNLKDIEDRDHPNQLPL